MPRGIPNKKTARAGMVKGKDLDTKNLSPEAYLKKFGRKKPGPAVGFKKNAKTAKATKAVSKVKAKPGPKPGFKKHLVATTTGRTSAAKPNIANKPKAERQKPGPKPGFKRKAKGTGGLPAVEGKVDISSLVAAATSLELGDMVTLVDAMEAQAFKSVEGLFGEEEKSAIAEMTSSGWNKIAAIKQIKGDMEVDEELAAQANPPAPLPPGTEPVAPPPPAPTEETDTGEETEEDVEDKDEDEKQAANSTSNAAPIAPVSA
jgi:hypothetical protein